MIHPSSDPGEGGPAAVLWDMDGTLIDSEKLWDVVLAEAAQRLGGELTADQRTALVGSNMAATSRRLLEIAGCAVTGEAADDVADWMRGRTAELFSGALPWRPGAREALEELRAAGVPCALVTSTERGLTELALNTIGREFFAATVCGDEVDGKNKPHPEPYLRAARLLGVDPATCVAVEDSHVGAASAEAAGCAVLVVEADVAVERGPGRTFRPSLVGVGAGELARLIRSR
ncbi:haloacid dehalogenase superfamily, subfamily IA, variant 3 with third motif having DD or ED [Prauserella aidingensis]|uniref:HAD family hydrolase n=1 Tax=Prauserella aidingensis TaxID=387890 RepID=UPI0027E29AF5|nr:HAD family phosphatase [Prauserella aidingensis]MCP2251539.1 haloacid dehalogenase superfamily, subfamily IA, variant 3 with third motif having DD or ED [Prauserella aidingensis]